VVGLSARTQRNESLVLELCVGRYVIRSFRFAFLAPDITEAILEGRQPPSLTVERLRDPIPYDWDEQRRLLGF